MFASHDSQREFHELIKTFEVVSGFKSLNLHVKNNHKNFTDVEGDVDKVVRVNNHHSIKENVRPKTVEMSTQTDLIEGGVPTSPVIVYNHSWSPEEKDKAFALINSLIVKQDNVEKKDKEISSLRYKLKMVLQINRALLKSIKYMNKARDARVIDVPDITEELATTLELSQACDRLLEETEACIEQVNILKRFLRNLGLK